MANWQALANRLNSEKSKRNAAPGYKKTISLTATAVPSTIEALLKDINDNDDTVYNFDTLSSTLPEDDYYSSMSTKIKFIEKKIIPKTECDTYNTCKPHTMKTCNPHTLTCSCNTRCSHSCCDGNCSCNTVCSGDGDCGCNTVNKAGTPDYWCLCERQTGSFSCSCQRQCNDSCCDGHGCSCVSVCSSNTPCSHCSSYTACPANCACYNVCTCVFV